MADTAAPKSGFTRNLSTLETMALSFAILSPSATAAITPSLTASLVGPSGPLAFLIGGITAVLIAFSFTQFAKHFAHSGSIYAYNTVGVGPGYGFVSGWILLAVYVAYAGAIWGQFGDYAQVVLQALGISTPWIIPGLLCAAVVWVLAHNRLRLSTRVMLVIEGVSIALILIVAAVILAHGGNGGVTLKPFGTNGNPFSAIGLAMVFAFLSYSGFEGSATLGEESNNPRRTIPRALMTTVIVAGAFFVFMSWVETIGFGLGNVKALADSAAPLSDLANRFVGGPTGTLIYLGATVSAFGAGLGCVSAGARILFSMGRSGFISPALADVHPKTHSPYRAVAAVSIVSIVLAAVYAPFASGGDVFGYLGTLGVLWIIIAYLLTVVGSMIYFGRKKLWRPATFVVPVLATIVLLYVLYSNIFPVPPSPYNIFPYVVLLWIVIGLVIAATKRSLIQKVSESFATLGEAH